MWQITNTKKRLKMIKLIEINGNLKIWSNQKFKFHIEINQTVTSFNIFDFWKLRQETNKQYPWCTFKTGIVFEPVKYSPQYLPQRWKDIAADKAKEAGAYEDEKHIFVALLCALLSRSMDA